MAVPKPSSTTAAIQLVNTLVVTSPAIAAACTNIPPAISLFRPARSESQPVPSWAMPQTAGYNALNMLISDKGSPREEKYNGKSPQAMPSFKLLTSPAWHTENNDRLLQLVISKTLPKLN